MAVVVLDPKKHANLKVKPNPSCAHMRDRQLALITVGEFARAANSFPIVIIKDDNSGEFGAVVLLGLQAGENLYYGEDQWKCTYAPLSLLRHPFILAHDPNDPEPNRLSLCFEDDGYVGTEEGEPIYGENGEETEVLKHYRRLIVELFENEKKTYGFVQKMVELELIVPFSLLTVTKSEEKKQLQGLYTIDPKRLSELGDEQVLQLHRDGYFGPIHAMIGSLGQFNLLVKYKNITLDDSITHFEVVHE